MGSNGERYKKDLKDLIAKGETLDLALRYEVMPDDIAAQIKKRYGDKSKAIIENMPSFSGIYQPWYSEAKALIRQVLPDRLADFVRYYEKPKSRKSITYENYTIEDCLQGLTVVIGYEKTKLVGQDAAIPLFRQQLAIVKSVDRRFENSLLEIRTLAQADLFDSELDISRELARKGFTRAAGAITGVVLEKHLLQVCNDHAIVVTKKAPGISDLNEALKSAEVLNVPQWRFIQHLTDIRNICDHSKKSEPTAEQVADLIDGVAKITKTIA